MKVKMRIEGTKELIKHFKNFGDDGKRAMSKIALVSAREMQSNAERSIRSYSQTIQEFAGQVLIFPNTENAQSYEVSMANVPMAAYVEFGTGAKVQIPDGWQDVAQEFFVNGQGTLPPFPYFIPAFNKVKNTYEKDLEDELNQLIKKYNSGTR